MRQPKQAILITAYKQIDPILQIIDYFDNRFEFYIHIDKKSMLDLSSLYQITDKKVYVYRQYSVNWGGFNHLKAILLLAEEALKNEENTLFHLITGEDFPCKPTAYFFENIDCTKDYIDVFKMPHWAWPDNGGMDRVDYYNFHDLLNAKKRGRLVNLPVKIQKMFKLKRSFPANFPRLYGGSTYWSLSSQTLQYVVDYPRRNKPFFDRMKYTFCAEEFYFQTVIMDSPFAGNRAEGNLRYIDWSSNRGGRPAFLDESDFPEIIASNALFARKLDMQNKAMNLRKMLLAANRINGSGKLND